jgi:hypothetical protein
MKNDNISIVLIGKNDDYGGNLKHRFKHCLLNLIEEFSEIIYVDWNSDGKSLIEEIGEEIPSCNKINAYIVTSEDIRTETPEYSNYSIVEVVARNIGIRRATKDWILVTNIDILIENFDTQQFDKNTMYTAARTDVPESFHLEHQKTNILLKEIKKNSGNFRTLPDSVVNGVPVWDSGDIWSLVVGCGDFQFAHKEVWDGIRGFEESFGGRCYADSNLMKKGWLNYKIEKCSVPLYHLNHGNQKISKKDEILPMNDRYKCVNNFSETTNTEDWGWKNKNLKKITF